MIDSEEIESSGTSGQGNHCQIKGNSIATGYIQSALRDDAIERRTRSCSHQDLKLPISVTVYISTPW